MIAESRCGILCSKCKFRESENCATCVKMEIPYWGEPCPLKDCCEGRGLEHCGLCPEFPCKMLRDYSFDSRYRDKGRRIEICRAWALKEF